MDRGRILVVDDEEAVRQLLIDFLSRLQYEVEAAADGAEALQKFTREEFDLVISDRVMPKMDGLSLLKEIKARDPQAIFMMITGYPTIETTVEAMKAGAYDYLPKPFHLDDVYLRVERALEKRRMQRSLRTTRGLVWGLILSVPFWLIIGIIIARFWN
jgi:DNA-binding NtrC family response regulator